MENNINKIKEELIKNLTWLKQSGSPLVKGGQSCGVLRSDVTLYCEELDIKITIGYHKSVIKNKELALTLFELAMDDLIK